MFLCGAQGYVVCTATSGVPFVCCAYLFDMHTIRLPGCRYGECSWDPRRADKLKYMLQASVSRRFPKGLKVHVQCGERSCLAHLFSALSINGFWITRADVRTLSDRSAFEFTLTDAQGAIPDHAAVQRICESVGGVLYQQQQAEAQQAPGKHGACGT